DKPDTGTYKLEGNTLTVSSPYIALKNGVAYSTEDRRDEGILSELSVRENMILALQAIRGWAHPISRKEQEEICATYIKALSIKTPSTETPIKSLSGGNQQKVLLARWLATSPKVLILDEPTRGIDIGAKSEIQETIVQLARQGKAIVFISSELSEVVRISSRVLILKDRKKVAEVENTPDFTQGNIVKIIAQGGVNENVK
ncbi:MAG: ATP-binding cassette domain-containing protein, partial [Bifidobacteriaceae bacterium]|nr:ATP-binding cassette domain-containing protein [Bifidobacteriaceae bacterium]